MALPHNLSCDHELSLFSASPVLGRGAGKSTLIQLSMPKNKEEVNVNCTAETFRKEKTGKKLK